jgi:hypothetical protein
MPNWVYNGLTIEGSPERIKEVVAQLNQPFSVIHDSWNVETGKMEKTPTSYNNPIFAFWNIVKPTDLDTYFGPQPKHEPDKPIAFDSDHWYDWNVRNWGTKWDVANKDEDSPYNDTTIEETDKAVIYTFNTAWSVPLPALVSLSSQYPDLILHLFYQEETGWGGEYQFMNGKTIREMSYDSQCPECDGIDCMEYCENDCGEVCSKCNWLGEADLDSVAECDEHKVFLDEAHLPEYRLLDKS